MNVSFKTYLRDQLWLRTVDGAIRRTGIYKESVTDTERKEYRELLRQHLEKKILPQYQKIVEEPQHLKNIRSLLAVSAITTRQGKLKVVLKGEALPFGVAQKILNLYLKYRWVMGDIKEPPHFPVDRTIQEAIGQKSIHNWTGHGDEELTEADYMDVIELARKRAKGGSLARYELYIYNGLKN